MAIINFDARTVVPDEGRVGPVPAAWYNFVVTASEVVPGKNDPINAARLNITCQIVDGEYAGRKALHGFNIKNPSAKAMEISFAQLSALSHAVGVLVVQNSEQLHNIPFKGKLKVTAATGEYEAKNEFTAFKHINDTTVGNAAAPAAVAPRPMPVAPGAPAFVAPAAPPAQAPAGVAPAWQAPAGGQPWTGAPGSPVQPAAQAPVMQQAPVQQAAPPAWNPQAGQVAQDPNVQPMAQNASIATAPASFTATQTLAPVYAPESAQPVVQTQPAQTAAPLQATSPAPAQASDGQVVPPWMQNPVTQ